jgi:hypothetical protein
VECRLGDQIAAKFATLQGMPRLYRDINNNTMVLAIIRCYFVCESIPLCAKVGSCSGYGAKEGHPAWDGLLFSRPVFRLFVAYFSTPSGGLQLGKKVLATIFDVCPRVALLFGRKYGRLPGGTHIPAGGVPHGYPLITLCSTNR